jgi:hypothetical protein
VGQPLGGVVLARACPLALQEIDWGTQSGLERLKVENRIGDDLSFLDSEMQLTNDFESGKVKTVHSRIDAMVGATAPQILRQWTERNR